MIKLLNKGKRTIIHAGQRFAPGEAGQFTKEAAEKLKRLYPNELMSLEDEVKRFDAPAVSFKADAPAAKPESGKKAGRPKADAPAAKPNEEDGKADAITSPASAKVEGTPDKTKDQGSESKSK